MLLFQRNRILDLRDLSSDLVWHFLQERARRKQKAGGSKVKVWIKKKIHQNKKRMKAWGIKRLEFMLR